MWIYGGAGGDVRLVGDREDGFPPNGLSTGAREIAQPVYAHEGAIMAIPAGTDDCPHPTPPESQ